MRFLLLASSLVISTWAACTDGSTNVFTLADVSDPDLLIHFENVKVQTYDDKMQPSCNGNAPSLNLPGNIKLVSGDIRVSGASDISSEEADLTLAKNSPLVGTVCQAGKSKNPILPDEDCRIQNICTIIGDTLCQLLGTPGTYDLETIEKDLNISSIITLPEISGAINSILKGQWTVGIELQQNGKAIGNIKLPGDAQWIYIN